MRSGSPWRSVSWQVGRVVSRASANSPEEEMMEKPHDPLTPPSDEEPTTNEEAVEETLDDAVEASFPASDPVAFISQPDNPEEPPRDPLAPPPSRDKKQPT